MKNYTTVMCFRFQVELEEREGKTDGTVAIQRMQEDLVKRHGRPVEMVKVLRTARMWYPGVQDFWDLPIRVCKAYNRVMTTFDLCYWLMK